MRTTKEKIQLYGTSLVFIAILVLVLIYGDLR